MPKLYIARTPDGSDLPLPSYASRFHTGLTLSAAIGAPMKISSHERINIPIGFAIGIPQGFCGQILGFPDIVRDHGIVVSGSPLLLNPADREPLFIPIQNISSNPYVLHRGEIIAQLLILPATLGYWQEIAVNAKGQVTDESTLVVEEGTSDAPPGRSPSSTS